MQGCTEGNRLYYGIQRDTGVTEGYRKKERILVYACANIYSPTNKQIFIFSHHANPAVFEPHSSNGWFEPHSSNGWFEPNSSNGSNLTQAMDLSNLTQAMVQTSLKQWMVRT